MKSPVLLLHAAGVICIDVHQIFDVFVPSYVHQIFDVFVLSYVSSMSFILLL